MQAKAEKRSKPFLINLVPLSFCNKRILDRKRNIWVYSKTLEWLVNSIQNYKFFSAACGYNSFILFFKLKTKSERAPGGLCMVAF